MRQGVPAAHLQAMAQRMGVTRTALLSTLRLSAATIRRKMQIDEPLSVDESERVLGIEYLIGQVQNMVNESGVPTGFDAAKWLAEWIYSPVPALGNKQPAAWLDTMEGQKLISDLLAMSQSGAYA
jgi:putative toxin-antitoxin system antitoxin component (TIGR02293 family)